MKTVVLTITASLLSIILSGCGGSSSAEANLKSSPPVSFDASQYVLAEEPEGAIGVVAARESAKDGEPIVIVGRIGGSANPWVSGRAAFMLLDASMQIVADGTESGGAEICMDDCCASERAATTTLVKFVDADGQVLAADARQLLGVAESDMVVVRGKVRKDDSGNVSVLADGLYIRR